jgi:hypothetical protein
VSVEIGFSGSFKEWVYQAIVTAKPSQASSILTYGLVEVSSYADKIALLLKFLD